MRSTEEKEIPRPRKREVKQQNKLIGYAVEVKQCYNNAGLCVLVPSIHIYPSGLSSFAARKGCVRESLATRCSTECQRVMGKRRKAERRMKENERWKTNQWEMRRKSKKKKIYIRWRTSEWEIRRGSNRKVKRKRKIMKCELKPKEKGRAQINEDWQD